MKLADYLNQMQQVMHDPSRIEATLGSWTEAGSAHDTNTRGLRFYVRAARHRRVDFARTIFGPLLDSLEPEPRQSLVRTFLAGHAGSDPDWYRNGDRFVAAVRAMVDEGRLDSALAEVADHYWAVFSASLHRDAPAAVESLDSLSANPTIEVLQFDHDVPSWVKGPRAVGSTPRPLDGPVLVAYYLHPVRMKPWWWKLTDVELAGLRIAEEGMPLRDAARTIGMGEGPLRKTMQQYVDRGLLVARVDDPDDSTATG